MPNKTIDTQISLRNWFAGLAMQGLNANPALTDMELSNISEVAYKQADAMINTLNSIKNRVDWSKAPDWATAHAVDSDFRGTWYEVVPEQSISEWVVPLAALNSRSRKAPNFGFQGEWTQSLVLRGES